MFRVLTFVQLLSLLTFVILTSRTPVGGPSVDHVEVIVDLKLYFCVASDMCADKSFAIGIFVVCVS